MGEVFLVALGGLVCAGLAGCDSNFGAEDGEVLFVVVPAVQPDSADSGIFVELSARPQARARLKIGIERGTVSLEAGTAATSMCLPEVDAGVARRYALVVTPSDTEAIFRATFTTPATGADPCAGAAGQSIVVAIHRPATNSPPDAAPPDAEVTVDAAAAADGGIDAQ
jgi:hypothetical protein